MQISGTKGPVFFRLYSQPAEKRWPAYRASKIPTRPPGSKPVMNTWASTLLDRFLPSTNQHAAHDFQFFLKPQRGFDFKHAVCSRHLYLLLPPLRKKKEKKKTCLLSVEKSAVLVTKGDRHLDLKTEEMYIFRRYNNHACCSANKMSCQRIHTMQATLKEL